MMLSFLLNSYSNYFPTLSQPRCLPCPSTPSKGPPPHGRFLLLCQLTQLAALHELPAIVPPTRRLGVPFPRGQWVSATWRLWLWLWPVGRPRVWPIGWPRLLSVAAWLCGQLRRCWRSVGIHPRSAGLCSVSRAPTGESVWGAELWIAWLMAQWCSTDVAMTQQCAGRGLRRCTAVLWFGGAAGLMVSLSGELKIWCSGDLLLRNQVSDAYRRKSRLRHSRFGLASRKADSWRQLASDDCGL